jgi:signal transduction histidine kinase
MWRISQMRNNQELLEDTVKERTREVTEKNIELEKQKEEIQVQNKILQEQKIEIESQTRELEKQKSELKESILSKDKIFSIISHDLRSPLGNIRNMLNLLIDKGDQFDAVKKNRILENLAEITKSTFFLLDNLLNWSRSERGLLNYDPQMFLIAPVINDVLELTKPLADKKEIKLISKIDETDLAFGDVNMVQTIFRNFIENALKFTHNNGTIEIFSTVKEDEIEFGVKDNGLGLDESTINALIHKKDINTTYGTNKEKGSGLGLYICKEFIRRNGGTFRIESQKDQGSTFYFTLKRFQM